MNREYRTTMMLPKISEEKKLEDERIQDFCASMKIEYNGESKKKLDVRSIYETDNETRQPRENKPGRNRIVSANKSKSSWNSRRDSLGFSRSHLFSAKASKKIKDERPTDKEETIDLTSMNDARKLTQRFYQKLGVCSDGRWSRDIESHLLKFENADLTFPNLWNKDELFERANKYTIEKQLFLDEKKPSFEDNTTLKHVSSSGKENYANTKTRTHSKGKKFERQLINGFDQVFYSKPASMPSINKHEKSKLISSHYTRLPSLNTRAVPWINKLA